MKKIILQLIIIIAFLQTINAAPITDSAQKAKADSIQKAKADSTKKAKDDLTKNTENAQKEVAKNNVISIDSLKSLLSSKDCGCIPHYNEKMEIEYLLVFAPLIVFFILFYTTGIVKNFKLNEALTENDQPKRTIVNSQYSVANIQTLQNTPNLPVLLPPTIDVSDPQPPDPSIFRASISRYIALITGLVILILVVCMSSFFIYHYIRTGCPPDFGALTMLLIALGLGVMPYITNKITTAASTNKS